MSNNEEPIFVEEADDPELTYYTLYSKEVLLQYLTVFPEDYKRCIITLKSDRLATCRIVPNRVPHLQYHPDTVINIKGRKNCGICFDGDEVVVRLSDTVVVGVLRHIRFYKTYVCLCTAANKYSVILKPVCGIVPGIKLKDKRQLLNLLNTRESRPNRSEYRKHVRVEILKWKANCKLPIGEIIDDEEGGHLSLQLVVDSLFPFRRAVERYDARYLKDEEDEEIRNRTEHYKCAITIDSPGCRIQDDAFTVEMTNGSSIDDVIKAGTDNLGRCSLRLGVHIADVSYFVEKGDVDDNHAAAIEGRYRGHNGVYKNHMLPRYISEWCSLRENTQKLSLSVVFDVDKHGVAVFNDIYKSTVEVKENFEMPAVEKIINQNRNVPIDIGLSRVHKDILLLLHAAERLRARRMGDSQYYFDATKVPAFRQFPHADRLVEDIMIEASHQVAVYLSTVNTDSCVPYRCQQRPSAGHLRTFRENFQNVISNSFYFSQYFPGVVNDNDDNQKLSMKRSALETLRSSNGQPRIETKKKLLGTEHFHPHHNMVLQKWKRIQKKAGYFNEGDKEQLEHYLLCFNPKGYLHFTSPLRRYTDIIVHRVMKAYIDGDDPPYSQGEITEICDSMNGKQKDRKLYSKYCEEIHLATEQVWTECIVEEFDESGITLSCFGDRQVTIEYYHLSISESPKFIPATNYDSSDDESSEQDDKNMDEEDDLSRVLNNGTSVTLNWEKRIYNAKEPFDTLLNSRAREESEIKSNVHCIFVPSQEWSELQSAIVSKDDKLFETKLRNINTINDSRLNRSTNVDSNCDIGNDEDGQTWKVLNTKKFNTDDQYYVKFSMKIEPGTTLLVQLGEPRIKGKYLFENTIQLVTLTSEEKLLEEINFCVLHRECPVRHLAGPGREMKYRKKFDNVDAYKTFWLPLLEMEAATNAANSLESAVCMNVEVVLPSIAHELGTILLNAEFCERRLSIVSKNKKYALDQFICIRGRISDRSCEPMWIGHGRLMPQIKFVDNRNTIVFQFKLHFVPHNGVNQNSFTVEFLPVSLPDRLVQAEGFILGRFILG